MPTRDEESGLSDLITRARSGDRAAWGLLFDRYGDDLRRRVGRAMGGGLRRLEDSTDIVNSVLKELPEHLQNYERHESEKGFLNWATKLVIRKVSEKRKHYGAQKRGGHLQADEPNRATSSLDVEPARVDTPSQEASGNEEHALLEQALAALTPADQDLLRYFQQDLPAEEVAQRLGCSTDAARMRIARARAELERVTWRLRRERS